MENIKKGQFPNPGLGPGLTSHAPPGHDINPGAQPTLHRPQGTHPISFSPEAGKRTCFSRKMAKHHGPGLRSGLTPRALPGHALP